MSFDVQRRAQGGAGNAARGLLLALLSLIACGLIACGDDDITLDGADASDGGTETDTSAAIDTGVDAASLPFRLVLPQGVDIGVPLRVRVEGGMPPFHWQIDAEAFENDDREVRRTFDEIRRVFVRVEAGSGESAQGSVPVTAPVTFAGTASSTVAVDGDRVAAVVPDDGALVIARYDRTDGFSERRRVRVCPEPSHVVAWPDQPAIQWVVTCARESAVLWLDAEGTELRRLPLPVGARPRGIIAGAVLHVALQGLGAIWSITAGGQTMEVAPLPDVVALVQVPGGVAAARYRSEDTHGEVVILRGDETQTVSLRFDPQPSADTESGGVPTLLGGLAVSPQGDRLALAGQQANIGEGTFINGTPLTFETSIRAAVRIVQLDEAAADENWPARYLFDNRGTATAAVYSPRGDYLYVLDSAHRSVERLDRLSGEIAGSLFDVGYGATGLALQGQEEGPAVLFVNAEASRQLRAYDEGAGGPAAPLATLTLVDEEPLPAEVLRGKQLFADSFDPRLARDGYIACANCHPGGDSDHRVWDFTNRGEGLRRTPALFGRAADGPLHWSANFDELQDFENDIRLHFRGIGLMTAGDFARTRDPMGPPKAGLSEDLDALAAYMVSLRDDLPSPFNTPEATPAIARGRLVFERERCTDCHRGARYTDSALVDGAPQLHDVGTLSAGSGMRLGGTLEGIDTPTLIGLWHARSYLHDGSATTLRAVLVDRNMEGRHGDVATLPAGEIDDLIAFLRSL